MRSSSALSKPGLGAPLRQPDEFEERRPAGARRDSRSCGTGCGRRTSPGPASAGRRPRPTDPLATRSMRGRSVSKVWNERPVAAGRSAGDRVGDGVEQEARSAWARRRPCRSRTPTPPATCRSRSMLSHWAAVSCLRSIRDSSERLDELGVRQRDAPDVEPGEEGPGVELGCPAAPRTRSRRRSRRAP